MREMLSWLGTSRARRPNAGRPEGWRRAEVRGMDVVYLRYDSRGSLINGAIEPPKTLRRECYLLCFCQNPS